MVYALKYRRRREGKTNYHKRLTLLKGNKTRLVVRRSNTQIRIQLVDYVANGDLVRAQANGADVRKAGLTTVSAKSIPGAYLAGYIAGLRAKKAGVTEAIVDLGMQTSTNGNRLYAAVKGVIDAGVSVPVGADALPKAERIAGEHITAYREVKITMKDLQAAAQKLVGGKA